MIVDKETLRDTKTADNAIFTRILHSIRNGQCEHVVQIPDENLE